LQIDLSKPRDRRVLVTFVAGSVVFLLPFGDRFLQRVQFH